MVSLHLMALFCYSAEVLNMFQMFMLISLVLVFFISKSWKWFGDFVACVLISS